MKMKVIGMLAAFTLAASAAAAQELPRKVDNVEVLDLDGNPAKLPHWGEKNLMIFYVDPDRHKQNNDFTIELEENHRAQFFCCHICIIIHGIEAKGIPCHFFSCTAAALTRGNAVPYYLQSELWCFKR